MLLKLIICLIGLIFLLKLTQMIRISSSKKNIKKRSVSNKKINIDSKNVQDADFEEIEK